MSKKESNPPPPEGVSSPDPPPNPPPVTGGSRTCFTCKFFNPHINSVGGSDAECPIARTRSGQTVEYGYCTKIQQQATTESAPDPVAIISDILPYGWTALRVKTSFGCKLHEFTDIPL